MTARDAARRLAEACRAQGIDPRTVAAHLDGDDLADLATHENAGRPEFWYASAWAAAESDRTGRCSCRRCVAKRRAQA